MIAYSQDVAVRSRIELRSCRRHGTARSRGSETHLEVFKGGVCQQAIMIWNCGSWCLCPGLPRKVRQKAGWRRRKESGANPNGPSEARWPRSRTRSSGVVRPSGPAATPEEQHDPAGLSLRHRHVPIDDPQALASTRSASYEDWRDCARSLPSLALVGRVAMIAAR